MSAERLFFLIGAKAVLGLTEDLLWFYIVRSVQSLKIAENSKERTAIYLHTLRETTIMK